MLLPDTVTARPRFLFTAFPLLIAVAAVWPDDDERLVGGSAAGGVRGGTRRPSPSLYGLLRRHPVSTARRPSGRARLGRRHRRRRRSPTCPPLLTAPGVVAADTKQYLYLDPGRLHAPRAASLWDPTSSAAGSPTRRSATCGRSGRGTGDAARSACPTGSPSACGSARSWSSPPRTGVLVLRPAARPVAGPVPPRPPSLYRLSPYVLDYVQPHVVILLPVGRPRLDDRRAPSSPPGEAGGGDPAAASRSSW